MVRSTFEKMFTPDYFEKIQTYVVLLIKKIKKEKREWPCGHPQWRRGVATQKSAFFLEK